ncbi:hypothetical protein JCM33374_g3940 [Metschnikowia sp. JCM 33374]|nr:hypothetical protein JCM33374_g3940 [Metschnikowia sp. JCM 33374]
MIRLLRMKQIAKAIEAPCWSTSSASIVQNRLIGSHPVSSEVNSTPGNTSDASLSTDSGDKVNVSEQSQMTGESESANTEDDITVPWYLRDDIKSSLIEEKEVKLPEIPPHAPEHVSEFLNLLATDYGMEDLLLFDMTTLDESHEYKANNQNVDFIIISTGKSERHILKASTEFRTHIKHKYQVLPSTEGIVSTAKTPAMRRKLIRRARKGPSSTDNEYGRAANSWVLFHHDNVDVHIMTSERRQELSLESIWCRPEDAHLYEQKPMAPIDSDHIFSGFRSFHTMANRRNYSSLERSRSHLETLLSQPADVPKAVLCNLKADFDAQFSGKSLEDFGVKYTFYKALHLINPEFVTFDEVECALLEKYTSSDAAGGDLTAEKIDDVTEYAKLLVNSTAVLTGSMESADTALDKLSRFISVLYKFSPEKFSMSQNPEFIPLLWRITFWEKSTPVSPRDVDQFIETGETAVKSNNGEPRITLASNNARDVLTLIDYNNKDVDTGNSLTPSFKELVLYTYGNAGRWSEFWQEWNSMFFPRAPLPQVALEQWVRLVTFLSLISDQTQSLYFLDYYWKNGSSVSGTFMQCFEANGQKFNSEKDKIAFIKSMGLLIDSLDPKKDVFIDIRNQLENL